MVLILFTFEVTDQVTVTGVITVPSAVLPTHDDQVCVVSWYSN